MSPRCHKDTRIAWHRPVVLNTHKLVGGATRVVMLKHRDNAPRPVVSFGGKSVTAVAMLVGGGLELPLPLYCVDHVSKALVDLRPEGAPALRTQNWALRLGFREYAHTPSRLWSFSSSYTARKTGRSSALRT